MKGFADAEKSLMLDAAVVVVSVVVTLDAEVSECWVKVFHENCSL